MIRKDIEPFLCEIIKNDIEEVHLAQWVDKINSHNHLDRRLLVFTDSGFALCRTKTFSKVPEITKFFSWFNLQSVELNENIFKFIFESEEQERIISFSFEQTNELLDVLCQHLANILIPSEYPQILVGHNFSIENYNTIPMTSGLSRLKANVFYDHEENDEIRSLFDSYSNFLTSGMTKLNLGLFGDSSFIGIIIDSLNVVPHITSVVFPSTKNSSSHWLEFRDLLKYSRYVNEIITHEAITKDFYSINSIKQDEFSEKIETITFGNPNLSDKEVDVITNLYKKANIKNIKFINAKRAMLSFKNNLNTFVSNSNFKSVTLDKILSLKVLTTLRLLRNVEKVGITGCDIEISEAIPVICSLNGIINTKSIDLSDNKCHFPLSRENLSLPECIEEMIFDNLRFSGISLQVLLAYFECQKSSKKLSIHINNINSIEHDKEFYQLLFKFGENYSQDDISLTKYIDKSEQNFNLDKIYFDNNKISKYLLRFFFRNKDLSLLSLNGSDFESDDQIIKELTSFITHTKTLSELRISGNLRYQLSPSKLELILQSFAHDQRSIKRLDISLHNYRQESLDVLSEVLLLNRKIEYVNFTRNNVYNKPTWQSFFKKLMGRGAPLDFPIPHAEFSEMLRSKEITKEELTELINMIDKIKKGNKDIKIPPETINPTPLDDDEEKSVNDSNSEVKPIINEKSKKNEKFSWEIQDMPVPIINNTVFNSFEEEFGIDSLLNQIKP